MARYDFRFSPVAANLEVNAGVERSVGTAYVNLDQSTYLVTKSQESIHGIIIYPDGTEYKIQIISTGDFAINAYSAIEFNRESTINSLE